MSSKVKVLMLASNTHGCLITYTHLNILEPNKHNNNHTHYHKTAGTMHTLFQQQCATMFPKSNVYTFKRV